MPVLVVANPKGGVGKSTLSTQVAGYWAANGRAVMLGDVDRLQSSKLWLSVRSTELPSIRTWEIDHEQKVAKPPRGTTHAVLDTPAALHGKRLDAVLARATRILIPIQASPFDMAAAAEFLSLLRQQRVRQPIAAVGMRVREGTHSLAQFRRFCDELSLPLLTCLRETQNYVHLAAQGATLWDVPASRVQKDLDQWQPICEWVDET